MPDTQPLTITLPPLRITLTEEQQVNLEWLTQNLPNLLAAAPSKPEVPDNLKQWVAANKLLNLPDADIIQYPLIRTSKQAAITYSYCRNWNRN
ncbi:hypothetical protein [Microcoleus sp. PH2017_05_CCC_O_A]|uniref:hypothetical protein n=1 Tax=Microcoleus sp. PH2017_05_CCC_O_A TaxID=2798816 RepID=UPI003433CFF6